MLVAVIVASLGVHLLMWPVGDQVLSMGWSAPPLPAAGGIMEVSLVGPEDELEPEPEPVPPVPQFPGELVRPDYVEDKRKPDDAKRVSEFDSRVERETRAPNRKRAERYDPTRVGEESGMGAQAEGAAAQDVPTHALPLGRLDPGKQEERAHPASGETAVDESGRARGETSATAPRPGFRGTSEAMRRTFGGSGSYDDLGDLEEGAENLLNTDRFRFASFYNRMRDQIAQHWDPNAVMASVDPEGRVYGRRTRKTLLHIRLTTKGAIKKIDIVRDSGVRDLDKEAIESVHLAAPFVNPPPEMVDARTGFIEIDFMFILQEGKTTTIRRYVR